MVMEVEIKTEVVIGMEKEAGKDMESEEVVEGEKRMEEHGDGNVEMVILFFGGFLVVYKIS